MRGHVRKGRRREALGLKWTPNWWWLFGWAMGPCFSALAVIFTILLSDNRYVPVEASLLVQAVAAGFVSTLIITLTEEIGWRGYLHDLWRRFGFWRTALATGLIWGVWHAPAIVLFGLNYPLNRELGALLFIVFCTLLAPLMTFIRDRGRSILAAGVAHGAVNGFGGLSLAALSNPTFPWNGVVGIGGFVALALLLLLVASLRPGLAPKTAAA
jgi:uncharacterized protein